MLLDLSSSLAVPRGKDASFSPEAARERTAALRAAATGTELPLPGGDAALLTAWTETFDAYVGFLRVDPALRERTGHWASFALPKPFRFDALVPTTRPDPALPELFVGPPEHVRRRDGFDLTDRRMSRARGDERDDYCLLCHDRDKDSCSKGLATTRRAA